MTASTQTGTKIKLSYLDLVINNIWNGSRIIFNTYMNKKQ